jgi:transposase
VPEVWRRSIATLLAVIDDLDRQLAPLERELRPLARSDERAKLLMTIPGVAELLGLTIAGEIGDIARFPSARKLVGYSGLTPRIKQSGQSERVGRLSKAGLDTLRWAAVEAAQQGDLRGRASQGPGPDLRFPPAHVQLAHEGEVVRWV